MVLLPFFSSSLVQKRLSVLLRVLAELGLLLSLGEKKLQHIYRGLHKILQANNKNFKEIV